MEAEKRVTRKELINQCLGFVHDIDLLVQFKPARRENMIKYASRNELQEIVTYFKTLNHDYDHLSLKEIHELIGPCFRSMDFYHNMSVQMKKELPARYNFYESVAWIDYFVSLKLINRPVKSNNDVIKGRRFLES